MAQYFDAATRPQRVAISWAMETPADVCRGEPFRVGVIAAAHVAVPVGNGSFVMHTPALRNVWDVEMEDRDHMATLYAEEKAGLLAQLTTLADALKSGDFSQEDA